VPTQWGIVSEPTLPATVCASVPASLSPVNGSFDSLGSNPDASNPDAARIQSAIDKCPSGQAVKLVLGYADQSAFVSGTLNLKSGVTLWIDKGVTLLASRNPADFDNGVGTCGTATTANNKSCSPLIMAKNTTGSAVVGDGVIDGRGGSVITTGPNKGLRSWWDVAYQNKSAGLNQQNPRLVQVTGGANFTLYRITLLNSPNFNVVTDGVAGVTAWGLKILTPSLAYSVKGYACPSGTTPDKLTPATCFTPDTVKNTDGFDPGQSSNVLLAYSYISTGDDNVAVKSSSVPGTKNLTFAHNHFYYGHGLSIGSETNGSLSNMAVTDLSMDGYDSPNSVGLRIKSDSSRGGAVSGVTYTGICMRNQSKPLAFDPFYSSSTGKLYPNFTGITISDFHYTGSTKFGGGQLTFHGYEANGQKNPLLITLDNVVFDGAQPTVSDIAATHFTLGPRAVSFASKIVASSANDITVTGSSGAAAPIDCSAVFVPISSVVANSPI
jgi:polygalacturonase